MRREKKMKRVFPLASLLSLSSLFHPLIIYCFPSSGT